MSNRLMAETNFCAEGCLLVAAPGWVGNEFERSVCLIVHHSSKGAIGVVLNRGLRGKGEGLWQHLAGPNTKYSNEMLHLGGPHSGPVVAVHSCEALAEYTSGDGVYFAAHVENLRELVRTASLDCHVKIFVGQAGWQPGELEEQFTQGKWLPLPVSSKLVFADDNEMWLQAVREIGNHFVASIVRCPFPPSDVSWN